MNANDHLSSFIEGNAENEYEAYDNENNQQLLSPRIQFFRQFFLSSTIWTLYFLLGLNLGTPTVLIAQLRKESEIDDETASWITSSVTFGALPWIFILPVSSYYKGRKVTFVFIYLCAFIGILFIYLSDNLTQLFIGVVIFSVVLGSIHSIAPLTINEYLSPKYRGIFMTIKAASANWGMWVSNAIGTFLPWKYIAILAFVCNIYTLTVFLWPESPYWLANNGKFAECSKVHRWLKGTSPEAEKELDNLVSSFKRYREEESKIKSIFTRKYWKTVYKTISCKAFHGPILIAILLSLQYHLSGKLVCSMYAIEILKKITQDDLAAHRGMLILDGITVFSIYSGCIISQFFKRRAYLLSTASFAIIFLYLLSLYLYLILRSVIPENNFITITLLGFYSVAIGIGPMTLLTSVCAELIPVRYQRSAAIIVGTSYGTTMLVTIKTSPFLFKTLTLAGVFLLFAMSSSIIVTLLYFYLPETKNKTLSEIEEYFVGATNTNVNNKIGVVNAHLLPVCT